MDNPSHFKPGNAGGPGRPKKTDLERNALELARAAVSDADLKAIITAQVTRAKRGDTQAAKLVLSYVIGLPAQDVNMNQTGEVRVVWDYPVPPSQPSSE